MRMCPFDTCCVHEVTLEISIVLMYPFDTLPLSTFHFRFPLSMFNFPCSTFHFPTLLSSSTFHFPLATVHLRFSNFRFPSSLHFVRSFKRSRLCVCIRLTPFHFPLSTFHFPLYTFHITLYTFHLLVLQLDLVLVLPQWLDPWY